MPLHTDKRTLLLYVLAWRIRFPRQDKMAPTTGHVVPQTKSLINWTVHNGVRFLRDLAICFVYPPSLSHRRHRFPWQYIRTNKKPYHFDRRKHASPLWNGQHSVALRKPNSAARLKWRAIMAEYAMKVSAHCRRRQQAFSSNSIQGSHVF